MKEQSQTGEKFIRVYSLDDDSPKVILFTDEQLAAIANFCCNDVNGHKSILYDDVTFQLGPFKCVWKHHRFCECCCSPSEVQAGDQLSNNPDVTPWRIRGRSRN